MSMNKFSLFLDLPQLKNTVDSLAIEVGNPSFMPHITLASHLSMDATSVIEGVKSIAGMTKPFDITFDGLGTENREFRFLCLLAVQSEPLKRLYGQVHQTFPVSSKETFVAWPHASILYGTQKTIEKYPTIEPFLDRFGDSLNTTTKIDAISIWDTSGSVAQWKLVESIKL